MQIVIFLSSSITCLETWLSSFGGKVEILILNPMLTKASLRRECQPILPNTMNTKHYWIHLNWFNTNPNSWLVRSDWIKNIEDWVEFWRQPGKTMWTDFWHRNICHLHRPRVKKCWKLNLKRQQILPNIAFCKGQREKIDTTDVNQKKKQINLTRNVDYFLQKMKNLTRDVDDPRTSVAPRLLPIPSLLMRDNQHLDMFIMVSFWENLSSFHERSSSSWFSLMWGKGYHVFAVLPHAGGIS